MKLITLLAGILSLAGCYQTMHLAEPLAAMTPEQVAAFETYNPPIERGSRAWYKYQLRWTDHQIYYGCGFIPPQPDNPEYIEALHECERALRNIHGFQRDFVHAVRKFYIKMGFPNPVEYEDLLDR